ncbi:MAG: hypothetical protein K2X01_01945 [Cyanobacteria bacterium]|nr:hypothetical protein [Cyanobacteriota bacterium]
MGSLESNLKNGYSQAKAYVDGYNARSKELDDKTLSSEKSLLPVKPSVVDNSAFVDNAFTPYTFQSGGQNYGQGNTYITNNYLVAPGANQSGLPVQNNGIYNPNLDPELNLYQPQQSQNWQMPQFNLPYQQQMQQQLMQMQQQIANMQEQLMQLIHALMERTGLRDMSYNPNQINPNAYGGNAGQVQGTVDGGHANANSGNVHQQTATAATAHTANTTTVNKTEEAKPTEETKKPDESGYEDSTMTASFCHATADVFFNKTAYTAAAVGGAVIGGVIGACVGGAVGAVAGAAIGAAVGVVANTVVGVVAAAGAAVVGAVCDIGKGLWDIFF